MSQRSSPWWAFWYSKGSYLLVILLVAVTIILSTPQISQGRSWFDLLRQSIQVIQLSNLSDNQEVQFGQQINQTLLKQGKVKISRNEAINRYITKIGQRLAQSSDRPNIPYRFQVVNNNSINAFATMGGFVYVHTGLIKKVSNEAELASVIAHEIGHIVGRHAIENMKKTAITQGLLTAAGLDSQSFVQLGVQLVYNLPNSRSAELEADQIGLQNLEQAGYAPIGMLSFMEKLLKYSSAAPEFLSTHPATGDRIEALKASIDPATANKGDGLNEKAYSTKIRALL
ncbi:peptidase [Aphanothece hegewaldii CCALA 016]|uniref:Peptidase n=1 Tax=Aphanothece hegewaldii CCALA 016 TaxID=2107694 RepID=A0A2T1LZJ0_9CHRO|nr:M48 family metallopeptidase [Aphanothece hegewaldii]PSF37816.1 peptidase [Aphanothece hegewaldii CCALA 016]